MSARQPVLTSPPVYWTTAFHPHAQYHDPAFASLAYRPSHVLLQSQLSTAAAAEQQQHRQQQQLALGAAGSGFQQHHVQQGPAFHHQQLHQHHYPIRTRQQDRKARQSRGMASYQGMTDEELAELQKQSNEYEPEATGPLVGQRQPSTAITTEYASADPVFQAKTAALPDKYSHYRVVRGDGKCGWRAVAFGYYETLIHLGDGNKFAEEEARIRSLSNVLNAAGFDVMLYDDFQQETIDLIRKLGEAIQDGTAEDVLLEAFNDEMIQNYIITHFKTLTAAWMKTRPQDYAPWLLGVTVEEFCNASIMPISSEIENVGLSALKDVCLSPAGITLEVLYLDRSEGDEVNMHRFSPVSGYDIGTIRLLYRPGHYDLLYTIQDLPPSSAPATIPTYLQYGSQLHQEPAYDLGVSDFMTMIPGMSYANQHQGWMSGSSYAESDFFPTPVQTQPCASVVPTPAAPAPQPQLQQQPAYVPPTPTQLVAPPTQMPQEFAIRTVPPSTMHAQHGFQPQMSGPFRPSRWEFEHGVAETMSQIPFQTSIFRNSHFNVAHFQNPDFQPEEWHPEDEYITTSSRSSKHRNSG